MSPADAPPARRGGEVDHPGGVIGAALLLMACGLLIVATFLPWVTTHFYPQGTFSGWVLARDDIGILYADAPDFAVRPFVVVFLGCAAVFAAIGVVVFVVRGRSDLPTFARPVVLLIGWLSVGIGGACGLLVAVILGGDYSDLQWGYWVVMLGGVTAFVGMLLINKAWRDVSDRIATATGCGHEPVAGRAADRARINQGSHG